MEFFKVEDNKAIIELNPKLYDLETIYSSAYQLIEDAFILLSGDPEEKITIQLSSQKNKNTKEELETIAKNFLNQLVNYTYYKLNAKNKENTRALLLKQSFESVLQKSEEPVTELLPQIDNSFNEEEYVPEKSSEDVWEDDSDVEINEDDLEFDDPEGIAIPWEEKFNSEKEINAEEDLEFDDDLEIPWEDEDKNEDKN